MMNKLYIVILLFATTILCAPAQMLHTTDAASDFDKGRVMYMNGNFSGCLDIMQSLLRRDEAAPYYDEAAFYVAMSQARRSSDCTEIVLGKYLQEYPFTIHRHEILLALGNYYYNNGNYAKAGDCYKNLDLKNVNTGERDGVIYRTAFCHIKAGEQKKAMPLLKALAQNSAKYRDEARYYEGYIHYENKDYSSAYRSLSRVNSSSRYGYEAQYILTNIDFLKRDYAKAIAHSEQLLNANYDTIHVAELHRIMGESHYQLGNDKKANEYLVKYLQRTKAPARNTLYMAGILAYRNGNYPRSIELLSQTADTLDAIGQNALLHVGLSHLQQKEVQKAAQAFERAALSQQDKTVREVALYNLALCYYDSNFSMFDSTISLFEKFLSEHPTSVYADEVKARLSDLYIHSRNYKAALNYIDNIKKPSAELLKKRQEVLYMIGTEEFANNSISSAGDWFTQAIKVGNYAPEYRARSIYWLGECCYRNKAYNAALKCYNQFLSTQVTTDADIVALAHYNAGYCHFEMNNYDKALTSFDVFTKQASNADEALLTDAYNRIGDCYFHDKAYDKANDYYAKASLSRAGGGDYALLQQAVISGINKKNKQKVAKLQQLIKLYPQSEYSEEVYNEMGQTYLAMNKSKNAIKTYQELVEKYPEGLWARRAMLQIGSIYYNIDDVDNSIEAYRALVEQHPTSGEAKIAAEELKSIYIEINRVGDLSAFMQDYGVSYQKNELDSLTYLAAERSYIKQGESEPFKAYIAQYPQGNYVANAYFHLGNVADAQPNEDEALQCYQNSLASNPVSEFAEDALIRCSAILYDKKDYTKAVEYYNRLETLASSIEVRQSARLGAMRCYASLQQHKEVIDAANRLLTNSNLSPEIKQEALYSRATAYTALAEHGKAYNDYTTLAADTRSVYGAESAYKVAEYLFEHNQLDRAEKAANAFVEQGTTHAYWMARNFILLSDIYAAKGDSFTAQQYLVQLKENYPGKDDDIASIIDEKLYALNFQQQ